jgi:hypothetical protein
MVPDYNFVHIILVPKTDEKYLGGSEIWCWMKMEDSRVDHLKNEKVLIELTFSVPPVTSGTTKFYTKKFCMLITLHLCVLCGS